MNTPLNPILVHDFLRKSAQTFPEKAAVIFGQRRITYREIDQQTDALSSFLAAHGLEHQDRVVVFTDNCPEAIVAIYGILKAGAVFVLLNGALKSAKLAYILRDSGASWLIADAAKESVVREAMVQAGCGDCRVLWLDAAVPGSHPRGRAEFSWAAAMQSPLVSGGGEGRGRRRLLDIDLGTLVYTSGSTGEPKGVMSAHCNMVAAIRSITEYLENTPSDVVLNCLPLSFDYGLYQALMTVAFGGTLVLEKSFLFVHEILGRISEHKVTGFPIVPTIVAMLLRVKDPSKYDLSSLRYLSNTGAALPVEHIQRLRALLPGVQIYSMFGLTECKRVCFLPPGELDRRPNSVGVAMPNCEVFVVDEAGNPLPPGVAGELIVRGQNVMQGYWNAPELTAKVYRPGRYPAERWMYSGDLFKMDEDGFLYFLGRKGDMIKCRGERVYPKEIENVLCRMPGLAEAAVVGIPDEILGEAIVAFVVALPGEVLSATAVLAYCSREMESFMVPKEVHLLQALPRSPNGKIDKAELKTFRS